MWGCAFYSTISQLQTSYKQILKNMIDKVQRYPINDQYIELTNTTSRKKYT